MKSRTHYFTVLAVLASMLAFSGSALTAPKLCDDGTRPPCDTSGSEPPDLGDIIVLYRDPDGLPYLVGGSCQQPIPTEPLPETCPASCVVDGTPTGVGVVSVNPETCAVALGCEACTQEVDFGRTSAVRSPVSVLEASLEEAVTKLATAQCLSLDPAGRLVTTSDVDGEILSAAIDSPLENLAMYRQLMLTGDLGAFIVLPNDGDPMNVLNTAARGLGAASDKTGKVTVDQVVYLNEIMGLTNESVQTYLPKKCLNVREEVQGTVQTVRKCFLDYGTTGGNYSYIRGDNFGALPAPAYIPESDPMDGWFEYLDLWAVGTPNLFYINQGPILQAVFPDGFGGSEPGFTGGNVGGFAQAADDARAVIDFMHSNPLPLGYETPVPLCDVPDTDMIYDLSLSVESGLQVPKQIVDGSEGREFTVTVGNAGPDVASGNVLVTADAANGVAIAGSPWTIPFTALGAGASYTATTFFSIDLGARTTIAWTATVIPDCATCDLNPDNNTVTATSNVRVTGSGGRP